MAFEPKRLNDLVINPRYEHVLHENGWTSLEALMLASGQSLNKPGLAKWRERIRLVARGATPNRRLEAGTTQSPGIHAGVAWVESDPTQPDHRLQTGATPPNHRLEAGATLQSPGIHAGVDRREVADPPDHQLQTPATPDHRLQTGATPDHRLQTGATQTLYLKRYDNPPRSAYAAARRSGWSARSLAGVEWSVLRVLADGGIASIEPIALGESLAGRRERCSAILTAAVPGESLERLVVTHPDEIAARRRALIAATAALVGRLHGMGLVHRDLYLSHLFADLDAPGDARVCLIDVQRIFHPARWRLGRWIVKDLASLNYSSPPALVSRADRLRWLRAYAGVPKLGARERRLIRRISAKTRRIARHDARRRRRWQSGSDAG